MSKPNLVLCRPERDASPVVEAVWATMQAEATMLIRREPALARLVNRAVLQHYCFASAMGHRLAQKLASPDFDVVSLIEVLCDAFDRAPDIVEAAAGDLQATRERDPACEDLLTPLLHFKGFLALQGHRVCHSLWQDGQRHLARHLQSRMSDVFGVDIHPAARLGYRILLDHGTGLVIGETAVVEDDVSILQEVTLGGTGKEEGDRHPKVRRGVLIGAGAKILGNIEIGEGAKVGAGSVVLSDVEPHTTVVGVPARKVGPRLTQLPALMMDHMLQPDYVI
jgi:serine O-acetyltransferase